MKLQKSIMIVLCLALLHTLPAQAKQYGIPVPEEWSLWDHEELAAITQSAKTPNELVLQGTLSVFLDTEFAIVSRKDDHGKPIPDVYLAISALETEQPYEENEFQLPMLLLDCLSRSIQNDRVEYGLIGSYDMHGGKIVHMEATSQVDGADIQYIGFTCGNGMQGFYILLMAPEAYYASLKEESMLIVERICEVMAERDMELK